MIYGEKACLGGITEAHVGRYYAWINDPETNKWRGLYHPTSIEGATEWVKAQIAERADRLTLAIYIKDTVKNNKLDNVNPVGFIGIRSVCARSRRTELWIYIGDKEQWGSGIGPDAIRTLCNYAFTEMNLYRIWMECDPEHTGAVRCYEKVGFKKEGTLRHAYYRRGEYRDTCIMGLLRPEFAELLGEIVMAFTPVYTSPMTTLRSSLSKVMFITLLVVALLTVAVVFGYAQITKSFGEAEVIEALTRPASLQVEAIIPSLLIPEQRSGLPVLLDRFKNSDHLEEIAVLENLVEIPKGFTSHSTEHDTHIFSNQQRQLFAVAIPIRGGNKTYGYLFKVKRTSNPLRDNHLLQIVEFTLGALLIVFFLQFMYLTQITARDVPTELSNLATWLEQVLRGDSPGTMPQLRFQELNDLGTKIAAILERHELTRDQAIVGQLTSGIMHDIKTPLHSIVTAHGLVAEQSIDSPKRILRLENLFKVCTTNLPVIGGIIESTLDGGRQIHIDPIGEDITDTLRKALDLHSASIRQRDTVIELENRDIRTVVKHDPVQMGRVFSNVIKNSIDALDEAKQLNRSMRPTIRLSVTVDQANARVVIEDNGPGFPHDPEKVFRLFRSSKIRGSGLGLTVSRRIVEAHDGTMRASRSTALNGARFDIDIPLHREGRRKAPENAV